MQTFTEAGFASRRHYSAPRNSPSDPVTRIPLHGGTDADGVTNVVQWTRLRFKAPSGEDSADAAGDAGSPRTAHLRGEGFPRQLRDQLS